MKKIIAILVAFVLNLGGVFATTYIYNYTPEGYAPTKFNNTTDKLIDVLPNEVKSGDKLVICGDFRLEKSITVGNGSILVVKGDLTIAPMVELKLTGQSILGIIGDLHIDGMETGKKGGIVMGDVNIGNPAIVVEGEMTSYNNAFDFKKIEKKRIEGKTVSEFLPIELTYFTVLQKGQDIVFEWETASETNNDFFTIEYSIDGMNFHELTTVAGSGTTSEATSYSYVWNADESGLLYFRLKQTDYNGEYSYSKVVALNFDKETIQGIYFQNGKIMYNGNPLRL